MSRRRHSESENDGGQEHKRRRTSEPIEIEDRLESLICRVGRRVHRPWRATWRGLQVSWRPTFQTTKTKSCAFYVLCKFLTTSHMFTRPPLPEKLSVYTTLVGLLNARNYNFGGEFVRFLSDLVNCHVIAAPSMVAMFENFISVTQEEDVPQVRADWYVYVVLSCLPWVGKELYEKKDVEMDRLFSQIDGFLKRRVKTHVSMLQVWTAEKPHLQEEYLDCLWAQIQKLKKDRWQERHILRPYIAFDSVLCEALQHNLPPFTPPGHIPGAQYPMPHVVFRMFDYTDARESINPCPFPPQGPVMPGSHSVERFVIEENLHCIIKTHWKERKTCAAQLLSYPGKNKIPLNYHIVEVIFGELFQLPAAPHIDVMYTTLLIELCKLQPGSLPQLAQATEMLFMRLDSMNTSCIDRLINWFSHHLSNFQFRWSWDDWSDCLTMDLEKPKPKFIKEVLEKSMRLSYHQRIVDIVPASFSALIPAENIFVYKYADESSSSLPGYPASITVGDAIKNRATNEEILAILKEVPNPNQEDDDDSAPPGSQILQPLLQRPRKVLKALTENDEGKVHILKVVYEAWKNHPQMVAVLVDKLIRTQIVDCAAILHSTIRKMDKHVQKIQQELEEAKDKLEKQQHKHKRDSGDEEDMEKNSEDEEGQLEEQIDRLQEKVESAQSEQKNLFLVIFQRFIMLLTEHLVRCETGSADISTPWYKNCIERLQQVFLMHHVTIQQYMGTLENLLFTAELDPHILAVYQQFCALQL
ncbi:hypothetical protein F7725_010580 [Dissostichus mawsoni]|uniref:Nuclear cap-binding protein subunit 1 n=1 Tax=Dissostichus mawsoni TaxID=36200 RepID=A0A7J5XNX5_DISMA|nr:hypothetical protein F7725_010580 [Dissostichus mawsoni]